MKMKKHFIKIPFMLRLKADCQPLPIKAAILLRIASATVGISYKALIWAIDISDGLALKQCIATLPALHCLRLLRTIVIVKQ